MTGRTWAVLLGVLAVAVAALAWMIGMMGPSMTWGGAPHMMWGYGGQDAIPTMSLHAWTWMLLAGLALIGFSLVLVSGVHLLSGWLAHRSLQVPARMGRRPAVPLVVLQRRYAAGEIDQATYDRMKRDLAA